MTSARPRPRLRLGAKLALLAVAGVVGMHAVHLAIGNRLATRALADEQGALGRNVARIVAQQAADALLVGDLVTLHELVNSAVSDEPGGVAYCFVVRGGRVLASSFRGPMPADLLALRADGDRAPIVVVNGDTRTLDVSEPILGSIGEVRVGLDMRIEARARQRLAVRLGLLALGVIAVGIVAALWIARSIARPVGEILAAADRFDPATGGGVSAVTPRGSVEIATLAERFNLMMLRLRAAHAEQTRAREHAVATERLVALGSLVGGVAHEVNNPLAGLKNCVRRLERNDLTPAKRGEYLALMDEGLDRIEGVVRQLLDFGRPHPPALRPVTAARLAEEAAQLVRPELERRRISVALVTGADALVLADRRMIRQALVNLLLNASHVTADTGEIRVRVLRRPGWAGISVEDDGPGIPPEIRDRILDPFFSTKPEGEGTGLGLSVTRTIADAHRGELAFEFPVRGGTAATLWLPEATPAQAAARG